MGQYLIQQFAYTGPVLIVYLVGMVLSIVFIRKYPMPAMFALAATLILFASSLGATMAQAYFFRLRYEYGWTMAQYGRMNVIVVGITTALRVLGSALLVAAVFVGRKPKSTPVHAWEATKDEEASKPN